MYFVRWMAPVHIRVRKTQCIQVVLKDMYVYKSQKCDLYAITWMVSKLTRWKLKNCSMEIWMYKCMHHPFWWMHTHVMRKRYSNFCSMHLPCIHWKLNKGTLLQLFNFQWIQGRLYSIVFVNEITTHCCLGQEFASVDARAPLSSRVGRIFSCWCLHICTA